jgi:hypothetical protein
LTVEAYVYIQIRPGRSADVAEQVRRLPGVMSADTVTGPYDMIATPTPSPSTPLQLRA